MSRLVTALLASLLLLTSGLVFRLTEKNRSLVEQQALLAGQVRPHAQPVFVPPLRRTTLFGDSVVLGLQRAGRRQILLVFNTTCAYCAQSLPAWRKVYQAVGASEEVMLLGVSLDSIGATKTYVDSSDIRFPVVTLTSEKAHALYGLGPIPHTLVIGPDGRVLLSRIGVVTKQVTVDSIVSVALPDL